MQFTKALVSLLFIFSFTVAQSQIKGKAKHLPGTWVYQQGSGFEVWRVENGDLIGAGYRTNKVGDTIRVELLGIREVKNQLIYTLETELRSEGDSLTYVKHQFISKRRKLSFVNIANTLPNTLKYSFGCFNKNKLTITVQMSNDVKKTKLILRRKV